MPLFPTVKTDDDGRFSNPLGILEGRPKGDGEGAPEGEGEPPAIIMGGGAPNRPDGPPMMPLLVGVPMVFFFVGGGGLYGCPLDNNNDFLQYWQSIS